MHSKYETLGAGGGSWPIPWIRRALNIGLKTINQKATKKGHG